MFAGGAEAQAYLLKSMPAEQMVETVRQVYAGKKRVPPEIAHNLAEHLGDELLTPPEIKVLPNVSEGRANRDMAKRFFWSEHTVKVHARHILGKLGANDGTHAIASAARIHSLLRRRPCARWEAGAASTSNKK